MSNESHRRTLIKALTWRVLAVLTTAGVAWVATHKVAFAATIGLADSVIKLGIYYAHERVWNRLDFGRSSMSDYQI